MDIKRTVVHIRMKPYLKAFFLSLYPEQQEPIFMPKRDKFNEALAFLLSKAPRDFNQAQISSKTDLRIMLPYFEHLNALTHNYLSEKAQRAFCRTVSTMFNYLFIDFMLANYSHGFSRNDGIDMFLEKYKIPQHSYITEMLVKMVYRHVDLKKKYPKRKYERKN